MAEKWKFWVDVGGTFTDCVAIDPSGGQHFTKVLSQGTAPITAIRNVLGLGEEDVLPPVEVRLGTTRGTNALLTRGGAPVCFVTTKGFGDLLRIGFQNRPDIFAIDVQKPEQLFCQTLEINERIHFDGQVEKTINEDQVRLQLLQVKSSGIHSLAICLLHAYRFNQHEVDVARIAREVGFNEISLSHRVAPEIRIIPRAYTTVLDAYLNPVLRSYIEEIRSQLHADSKLTMFSSSGSLVSTDDFTGKDSILSGPAGGVVGFSKSAQQAGINKSIGFDMGGTSTDVSRFEGSYNFQYESQKSGLYIVAPTLAIETVAAGGGSICSFDGMRLKVGPQSAGADPGPAFYGNDGPLCLSDINLFLGRIHAETFPIPVDREAVENRLQSIQQQMIDNGLPEKSKTWIAEGFLKIAVAKTAEAIRLVSIQKGYDCAEYALVAFGGAAGQIACLVAEELSIDKILCHPQAGILSAVGIGLADQTEHDSLGFYANLTPQVDLDEEFLQLEEKANDDAQGDRVRRRKIDLRYQGTESWLTIPYSLQSDLAEDFEKTHQRRFGYVQDRPLEIGCLRIETTTVAEHSSSAVAPAPVEQGTSSPNEIQKESKEQTFPFIDRASLARGAEVIGPAMICDPLSTVIVDHGWKAECLADFQLLLSRVEIQDSDEFSTGTDQIKIELLNNQLFSIAEQMGEALRATAVSVNVKERLDFSCAIFDGSGNLIANAPHIPIHLGAMSECVKCLIEDNPEINPGDVFVTNDPYRGGSHLPDITVVSPIFPGADSHFAGNDQSSSGTKDPGPVFWVASRAHHAEIGGKVPGSMPPDSVELADEGVLIQNFKLVDGSADDHSRFDELRQVLTAGPYPSRQPDLNLSDIKAQMAANRMGIESLSGILESVKQRDLDELISSIYRLAAVETERVIAGLEKDEYYFEDHLDCGARVVVRIRKQGLRLAFDFTGSSPTLANNQNANSAIVHSAIIYCLRLLIGKDIPLNQGILDPIDVVLPECFLNPKPAEDPAHSPAIVGGNVETSQRVVDAILGALGVAAASQGTSNNVIFGDEEFGYYETVCGGGGATATSPGADAIQCHITNTRITDPEILETRYPVILEEFRIRTDSGGRGKHSGGNGVIRRLRFRRPLQLSVLCNRYENYVPFGLEGGQPGATGELETSPHGMVLKTPGGGGFGEEKLATEASKNSEC